MSGLSSHLVGYFMKYISQYIIFDIVDVQLIKYFVIINLTLNEVDIYVVFF